jgi:hypothetical protein
MTASRIARELWWTDQEFSPVSIIPPWFSILIYVLEDKLYRSFGGRSSEA